MADITGSITKIRTSDNNEHYINAKYWDGHEWGELASALKYCGITTTKLTDGATTNPVVIGGKNHTATAGCVVFYEDTEGEKSTTKEFVFNGSKWELLGADSTYKVIQSAVSSPNADGSALAFIDTISQDANGVITVSKKNVDFSNVVKPNDLKTINGESILGEGDINLGITPITWADLVALRDNSMLVPGQQYRIADYITTTAQANTKSAGHQFDVIVTADNENTLNEVARACLHEGDTYFSEAGANLAAWQIWYSLDNDDERFAWACPSDGMLKKVALVNYGYTDYTARREPSSDYELNGKTYYAWSQGGGPNQVGYSDTLDITSDSIVYDSSGAVDSSAYFLVEQIKVANGKGVIYHMIDEHNNDLPYDFKNILFIDNYKSTIYVENQFYGNWWGGKLIRFQSKDKQIEPGLYRYAWVVIEINGPVGPCTIYYTDSDRISSAETLFYEYDGENWVESTTLRITNLLIGTMQYTFGVPTTPNGDVDDCVDNTLAAVEGCISHDNTIGACMIDGVAKLNSNSFGYGCNHNSFGDACYHNSFGDACYYNSFGNNCNNNSFGNNCYSNSFGDGYYHNSFGNHCVFNSFGNDCDHNSFVDYCNHNSFVDYCNHNSFGNHCVFNSFGNDCRYNSFGNDCRYNSFDNGCLYNSFGDACHANSFGNYCDYNSFGNYCSDNSFGNDCDYNSFRDGSDYYFNEDYWEYSYEDELIDGVRGNKFGDRCQNLLIYTRATTGEENSIQNLNIAQGLCSIERDDNDIFIPLPIEIDIVGQNYEIKIGRDSNDEIKVYVSCGFSEEQYQEVTYSELVALRDTDKLVAGSKYRITDYITTTTQAKTLSAEHQFDIIVTADTENTLHEIARACLHEGDTYFSENGAKLEAWQIWYCLDNDTERFAWADGNTHGRGVIYRMIDEWNNDCPYDFKNIKFRNPLDTDDLNYYYTFNRCTSNGHEDMTVILVDKYSDTSGIIYPKHQVTNNIISTAFDTENTRIHILNSIIFIEKADFYYEPDDYSVDDSIESFYNNKFSINCVNMIFENSCYNNTFGESCNTNRFGELCYSNTFGNNCYSNTFGNKCYSNTFGYNCYNNTFGNDCYSNTFGYNCSNNTFGNDCYSNTFGNYYRNNTFGCGCYSNTFGNRCYSNIFGNNCYGNTFWSTYRYFELGNDIQYVIFKTTDIDGGNYSYAQNYKISHGLHGTYYNKITISLVRNLSYEMKIAKNSKGEVKIYCEADLIA